MNLVRPAQTLPPPKLLLLAAIMRHTAGYCWAFNTRLFFQVIIVILMVFMTIIDPVTMLTALPQHYYPDYDIGLWTFCASVFGGSFGVFAGGFFSDRLVKVMLGRLR